jgi:phage terminase Nu1 subunit (DNA packaging protein)
MADSSPSGDLAGARKRLLKAQADRAELEAARMAGKLTSFDDALQVSVSWFSIVASQMDGLGAKLSGEVAAESNPALCCAGDR